MTGSWTKRIIVFGFFATACSRETTVTEQPLPKARTSPVIEPSAVEPTEVKPAPEQASEPGGVSDIPEQEPGIFDFEDGTTQGWRSRQGKSSVSIASDMAHYGS